MKIPYGIHDYKRIKTKDYLFVDKTKFIEELERIGEYNVFLRPRRFGKSLFTSMLYYYYDIKSIDIFSDLFGDTYIGQNKTGEASSYYMLKFDFSGMNTNEELIEGTFAYSVRDYLNIFINYYKLDIKLDTSIRDAGTILKNFFSQFIHQADKQIYLVIDEYDHFANNVLTTDIELFNKITGKDGFVRNFYEVFKTYAGTVIGRIFITGVTPITLDSLTSGFNMAKNFTKYEPLNEMMGFTENEMIDVLNKLNIDIDCMDILRVNYNGYLFNKNSKNKVYNSNMVLYYLDNMVLQGEPPENLTDPNIISDYTKITSMFDLYKNNDDKKEIIHNILTNQSILSVIVDKFNIKFDLSRDDFLSILYYLGLITIEGGYGIEVGLKTPNYVIKNVYFEYYYHYLNKELNINIDVSYIRSSIRELSQNNNIKPFISLVEKFLKEIDNRDFIKFDEKYIKLLMMTYASLSGLYLVKSEYSIGKYYIDLVFFSNNIYELENYFIFELKYISKNSYNDKLLNQKRTEAIEQINKYMDNEDIKNIKNLRKYIIVFVNDECRVVEEI